MLIKRKNIIIIFSVVAIFAFLAFIIACSPDSNKHFKKANLTIIIPPTASNLVVGQSTDESRLSGKFSVEGNLNFSDEAQIVIESGVIERTWIFVPDDVDRYNILEGKVKIEAYNYILSFEENGGFDIDDVYFNKTFTLKERPITAKNEYRFDGWVLTDGSTKYIDYPHTFISSATLYAEYTFHTVEKLKYSSFYSADDQESMGYTEDIYINNVFAVKRCCVSQNNEKVDSDVRNIIPTFNHPLTESRKGSIEGEVVIADMYNDHFVTGVMDFYGSGITSFIFNNFVTNISGSSFAFCINLDLSNFEIPRTVTHLGETIFTGLYSLKNLFIPNTVAVMGQSFAYCYGLETVEFEDGEQNIEVSSAFLCCYNLQNALVRRATRYSMTFYDCYSLECVKIDHCAQEMTRTFTNCISLTNFETDSDRLQRIGDFTFANCRSISRLKFPSTVHISPLAFYGSFNLIDIGITDEQIGWIAQELHDNYIGGDSCLYVNIDRDEQYSGLNCQGNYVSGGEVIDIKFDSFSINALYVLIHEFFHHYQYVLIYGVGEENFNTVNVCSFEYYSFDMPGDMVLFIVANDCVEVIENDEYVVCEKYVDMCEQLDYPYILLIKYEIQRTWGEYIELLPDESNYQNYWDQPFEVDARNFACLFTGIYYE